mmetsp:Transcript_51552/g.104941  ORF Transcript_51552/g.104941 Transcript_51552/m.104941 type:complete len:623 (-) Transcript_51552:406-2274(-)
MRFLCKLRCFTCALLCTITFVEPSGCVTSRCMEGSVSFIPLSVQALKVPVKLPTGPLSLRDDKSFVIPLKAGPYGLSLQNGRNNPVISDRTCGLPLKDNRSFGPRSFRTALQLSRHHFGENREDDVRAFVGTESEDNLATQERRTLNTNRAVATVAYFWWRNHKEKHNQLPAESLEVLYTRGMLGGGTYGEVFHAVVSDGYEGSTLAVAKRAKDGSFDPDDPSHQDLDDEMPVAAMDSLDLERHLEMLDMHNKAFQYLQVEAFMNDLVKQLCPHVAAPYMGMVRRRGMRWLVWEYAGSDSLQTLLNQCEQIGSLEPLATALHIEDFEDFDGDSLQRLINEVARQLLECCLALEFAGVAHRDVKPDNLIVTGGRLRLIDFGSAAAMGLKGMLGYDYRTAPCDPCYAPPEQFIDEVEWAKYDVYCVGLTLLRILFPPLHAEGGFAQFRQIFRASGHDIEAWFKDLILADPNMQTVQGRNRAELPDLGFPRQGERIREYERLAGLSCVMQYCDEHGTPPLSLCALKEGLAALSNDHVEGLVWDILHSILQPEPCLRPSASEALRQLSGERSRRGDRGQHPHGWERRWDAHQGRHYYANHITKVTQWQVPREWQSDAAAIIAAYTE